MLHASGYRAGNVRAKRGIGTGMETRTARHSRLIAAAIAGNLPGCASLSIVDRI
jgi:hypothetical protein